MKRLSTGEQGYRLGVGEREIANPDEFLQKAPSEEKALASKDTMSTRRIMTAKGAKRPPGSPRPGNFPSAIEQIGNPFGSQSNGTGSMNGTNNTTPSLTFGQGQPAQPSLPYTSAGSSITFNSLGQATSDSQATQKSSSSSDTNSSSAVGFTFGSNGASGATPAVNGKMPSTTFNFGGPTTNNPFSGLSQQSNAQSGSLFSTTTTSSAANSFPPNQPSTFSGFGKSFNTNNQGNVFGGLQSNQSSSSFPAFGSNESQKQQAQTNPSSSAFGSNAQQPQQTNNIFSSFGNGAPQQQPQQTQNMFSNLNNTSSQQQSKAPFSFGSTTESQQPSSNLFSGMANAQNQQGQQKNGLFQEQNSDQSQQITSQPSNGLFSFAPAKQDKSTLIKEPSTLQNQSGNLFEQQKPAEQSEPVQEASTLNSDDSMQVSPPRHNTSQRSIFDTVASGDNSSQSPQSNIFGYLHQYSAKQPQPSLFSNSATSQNTQPQSGFSFFGQNQGTSTAGDSALSTAPQQANTFSSAGDGKVPSQAVGDHSQSIRGQSSEPSMGHKNIFAPSQAAPSFGFGSHTDKNNQNSAIPSTSPTPSFQFGKPTGALSNNDSETPKQGASSTAFGTSINSFGTQDSTGSTQSSHFPNFGTPASTTISTTTPGGKATENAPFAAAPSPSIFSKGNTGSESSSTFVNSGLDREPFNSSADKPQALGMAQAASTFQLGSSSGSNSTSFQSSSTPKASSGLNSTSGLFNISSPGPSNKRKAAETTESPSSKALKSKPFSAEPRNGETPKLTFGYQAKPPSGSDKPAYAIQSSLRALNRSFMKTIATMDDWKDHTDMMSAYISQVNNIKRTYAEDSKRRLLEKPQDETQQAPKKMPRDAEPSSTRPADESKDEPVEVSKRTRHNIDPPATPSSAKSSTASLFQNIVNQSTAPARPAAPLFFGTPKTPTRELASEHSSNETNKEAPATEPPNANAGKSLFDRISPADKPVTENKKPVFSFFPPTPTKDADVASGDHTWKPDSPIKFGTSQNTSLFLSAGSAAGSATTSRATSPGAGDGGTTSEAESATSNTGADDEELVRPHEEQLDLTAVDANSEVLFEADKARGMIQNAESKTWDNKGTGPLRILKDKESAVVTVLLRTFPSGRIVFNSRLNKDLTYKTAGKNAVLMPVVAERGKIETWHVRFKAQQIADEFAENCQKLKA